MSIPPCLLRILRDAEPMVGRLREIDALRGVAAAVVAFVFHQHYLHGYPRSGPLDGLPGFTWLHDYGWSMVDLFFVISGYIFAHVYLTDWKMNASLKDFALARFARLYPLHFATLIAAASVLAIFPMPSRTGNFDIWHFTLNLFMLQESGLNSGMSFNVPAWSISVEVFCYALFFLFAARWPRLLTPFAFALVFIGFAMTAQKNPSIDHIARGVCGFFAGIVAYRLRDLHPALGIALIVAGALLFPLVHVVSKGVALSVTCWTGLVLLAPRMPFLRWAPLVWLGDRSYSIYLIHGPALWFAKAATFGSQPVPSALIWPVLISGVAFVLILADLSYRYLERPARQLLRSPALHAEPRLVVRSDVDRAA